MSGKPSKYGECDCGEELDKEGLCLDCDDTAPNQPVVHLVDKPAAKHGKGRFQPYVVSETVEQGLPIPKIKSNPRTYPFDILELRDSFKVTTPEGTKHSLENARASVSSAHRKWRKRADQPDHQLTTRITMEPNEEGAEVLILRVWRTV